MVLDQARTIFFLNTITTISCISSGLQLDEHENGALPSAEGYSHDSRLLAEYLLSGEIRPADMSTKEFVKVKRRAQPSIFEDRYLFRKPNKTSFA